MPERARGGYLFEYELVRMCRTGASVKYNNKIYKPGSSSFEAFKDREDEDIIVLHPDAMKEAHEVWQTANAKVNSFLNDQIAALKAAQAARSLDCLKEPQTFEDIESAFNKLGGGPHLLLLEFEPSAEGPIEYETKRKEKISTGYGGTKSPRRK